MSRPIRTLALACVAVALLGSSLLSAAERIKISVPSSIDGTGHPSYLILPDGFTKSSEPAPLLVSLHSWSADLNQRHKALEDEAAERGWIYLFPNFRGPNDNPDACGSLKAQQDILDARKWVIEHWPVDRHRIYLTGSSGGGHMTMLMAGRHPEAWTAASAWVGISDLASWEAKHANAKYGRMVRASCGGAPGASDVVDKQYRARSPITWMAGAKDLPLDLAAGVHDGYKGSVPIRNTLDAFNAVARAQNAPPISEEEIRQLSRPDGHLEKPQPSDTADDPTFGRKIYLRRTAGKARVTIFEGGHEQLPHASMEWLSKQVSSKPL